MVVSSKFRMGEYGNDDHRKDASHFKFISRNHNVWRVRWIKRYQAQFQASSVSSFESVLRRPQIFFFPFNPTFGQIQINILFSMCHFLIKKRT